MSDTPRVSVIIPCYNAGRFLGETLESVFTQAVDCEVIAVDDGSTDNTSEVLRSWQPRVRVVRTVNRGVSLARNTGTTLARGDFFQYLDADDRLTPDALKNRLQALDESRADVAYSDYQRLEEDSQGHFKEGPVIRQRLEDVSSDPAIALLTDFWVPPACLLYRRSVVDRIGGWNESLPVIQDARFALDAALSGAKFIYAPGVGASYRVLRGMDSLSRRNASAFSRDVLHNAHQIEERWVRENTLTPERREALARVYETAARRLLGDDETLFKESLERLYRLRPGFEPTWPKVGGMISRVMGPKTARWVLEHFSALRSAA